MACAICAGTLLCSSHLLDMPTEISMFASGNRLSTRQGKRPATTRGPCPSQPWDGRIIAPPSAASHLDGACSNTSDLHDHLAERQPPRSLFQAQPPPPSPLPTLLCDMALDKPPGKNSLTLTGRLQEHVDLISGPLKTLAVNGVP